MDFCKNSQQTAGYITLREIQFLNFGEFPRPCRNASCEIAVIEPQNLRLLQVEKIGGYGTAEVIHR